MTQSTTIYNYPLPTNSVPEPNITKNNEGQYLLPSARPNAPRCAYNTDYHITHILQPRTGLDTFRARQTITALAHEPSLLNTINTRGGKETIERDVDRLMRSISNRSSYTGPAAEWGQAIRTWILALEYGTTTYADVPPIIQGALVHYYHFTQAYHLTLDKVLTNRMVYNKETTTVSPTGLVYRNHNNSIVVTHLTTGKLENVQIPAAIRAGLLHTGERILQPGSKTWANNPLHDDDVFYGILHLPRSMDRAVFVDLDTPQCDMYADTALFVANQMEAVREDTLQDKHDRKLPVDDMEELVQSTTAKDRLAELYEEYKSEWDTGLTKIGQSQLAKQPANNF